ncbi:sigma-70 family RNA polymerase sigma factor [Rhodopirellula sallentina]|uniref:Extracytoplasmic function alternative sigma factor n=1 Tax=Rhodopirellula sallentina SM41 TaxID=1263870 RepID=M5U0P1_9BACT|nr:sigma-70 family RNA polymerase sigma factor [Rhodopirellula sallentina]EMI55020.1 extracytoplasmic function alternative sigma factor [Rhodopirellula sallentina SM41]
MTTPEIQSRPSAPQDVDSDATEQFLRLLGQHERMLAAFVMSMLPNVSDSDDILQETKIALWQSFDSFEIGTDFGAWARRAALYRILDFRKRMAREKLKFGISEENYRSLAKEFEDSTSITKNKFGKLATCLARLPDEHQQMIRMRYMEKMDIDQIASASGRSRAATYRILSRIRLSLRECVKREECRMMHALGDG